MDKNKTYTFHDPAVFTAPGSPGSSHNLFLEPSNMVQELEKHQTTLVIDNNIIIY